MTMPNTSLSAEKRRHLNALTDEEGRFAMLAVDQRQSLRGMIADHTGQNPAQVPDAHLTLIKRTVAETVADIGSAVLLDPVYGYPQVCDVIGAGTGLLVSAEKTGYEQVDHGERRSRLVKEWSPRALRESGIDALKLLVWHNPEVSDATRRHQETIVEEVGGWCAAADVPLLLEAKTYLLGDPADPADMARARVEYVIDAASTYSARRFRVDVLKMEFPAELKYATDGRDADFGRAPTLFTRADVEAACRRLDQTARVPWVILSAGVDLDEFLADIHYANAAGASGFLCGRTIWKDIISDFPDAEKMKAHMLEVGRRNFKAICAASHAALPWNQHRRLKGKEPAV